MKPRISAAPVVEGLTIQIIYRHFRGAFWASVFDDGPTFSRQSINYEMYIAPRCNFPQDTRNRYMDR